MNYSRVLQQLLNLRIILCLDLRLILEVLLYTLMLHILEPMAIKRVLLLFTRNIMHHDWYSHKRSRDIQLWLTRRRYMVSALLKVLMEGEWILRHICRSWQ